MTTSIVSVDATTSKLQVNNQDALGFSSTGDVSLVQSINGGQLAGLRNRVINGQGWINQRGNIAVSAGLQYGPDRMMASISGSPTGISGNITSGSLSGTATLYGWGLNACSWTNGAVQFAQRIESWNVRDMNSKTVTFSGKIFQDTGGTRTFNIIIQKATAVDNFTSTTTIASTTVSIPSGVTTPFSFTTTLGATDATNGIMLIVADSAVNTVTSKTYYTSDWQFEVGSVATTFEQRPIGLELALCQRYTLVIPQNMFFGDGTLRTGANIAYIFMPTPVSLRATPAFTYTTITAYSGDSTSVITSIPSIYFSGQGLWFGATFSAAIGIVYGSVMLYTTTGSLIISAEL